MRYATDRTLFLIGAAGLVIAAISVVTISAGSPHAIAEIWPNVMSG